MKKTIIIFLFVALAFQAFAIDRAMPPLAMPTAASNGFGGTHIAFTDNVFALLVNPAALMRVRQSSIFALSPSIMNPQLIADTANFIRELSSNISDDDSDALEHALETLAENLGSMGGRIALGLDLREFPLSIAWAANGFGFGIWNRTFVNTNIQGIWVSADIYEDVIFPIGFAFKILELDNHAIDAGISFKPFLRGFISEHIITTDLTDDSFDIIENINIPIMAGFGFDLGLLYRMNSGFSAGVTFTDIYTQGYEIINLSENIITSYNYFIPFAVNLGLAYDFRVGNFLDVDSPFLNRLGFTLAFDWRNIVNAFQQFVPSMQENYLNRNAFLDIGVGLQVSLLDRFRVSVGMSDMLPSVGLGLTLGAAEIDLAYYGKEFGREPGLLPTAMVDLTIAFRPKAKERNWFWTRRAVVGTSGEMADERESDYYYY